MREKDKTKEQLIVELHELCQRLAESEETKEESKRAEEALRESERRYREFFATSRDCVFITSKAGKWIDFNDAAMEMFGYESREELLQVPVSDLYVNPDERTALTALIERQGYVKEHPVLLRRRDGVVIDTLITTGLRRSADGREIEYFGTIRDITERKRVEKELFESENKFKSFAENALVGVYLIQDGVFKYANPKFAQMFGYTVEECLNDMPFKKLVYAEDLAKVEEQVEKRTSGRGDFVQYTFRGVKKDGEIFHVEVHGSASLHKGRPAAIATILDITERKQAEDALRESEERFRTLYENAPVLIDGFDKDGRCILWNRECEKVFGWTIDEINSHDDPLALFYPDPDVRREVLDTVTTRPEKVFREWHPITKAGKELTALWANFQLPDGMVINIGYDITEHKQAEEALRNSEHRLSQIVEFLPDAALVIDKEGKVVAWNRAMEDLTGVQSEAIIGKGDFEYAIPFFGERRPILIDLALQPRPEFEGKYTGISWKGDILVGEAFVSNLPRGEAHLSGTATVLRDAKGEPVAAIECIRDNTDRKQVEERLRETRDFLENLLDHASSPIIVWDSQFRITLFNRAFERLTGRSSSKVLGLGLDFLFPPEKLAESLAYFRHTSVGEPLETVEVPIQHVGGSVRVLLWNSATLYGADGKTVVATIAQGHDITERRKAQEEQRKLEARLAQVQKLEAIGTLAGGIAHDFNNILGIIMGYAEIVGLEAAENSNLKMNIDQVLKATHRARDLVKQILTISRKTDQERKPLQVTPIVKETIKLLRASLPTVIEIRQRIDLSEGDDLVLADPTQIHQVLMNLATNAAHAMRENGGVLRMDLSSVHFNSLDADKPLELGPGGYLKITVEDTGHGMHPSIIDRIFDPYFTTKGAGEGTGLGLAIVHGIVKGQGGAVTVDSEPGKGTAFQVYLPKLERQESVQSKPSEEIPTGSESILVVDDEQALVDAVRQMLEHLEYNVTAATNGTEALSLFLQRTGRFDLVVTDYTMPKMTGADLAREIRQIRPDLPIILCTGFNERISMESIKEIGITELMRKPVSLRGLGELVRKVLNTEDN